MLKTLLDIEVSPDQKIALLFKLYKKYDYKFYFKRLYNLNIFGIRTYTGEVNKFDDYVGVCFYREELGIIIPCFLLWKATTDPGLFYLKNPSLVQGTAILKEGQYPGAFALSMHRNKYLALCQRLGPVEVYRDRNKDDALNFVNPESGYFGINIHRANRWRIMQYVGRYSAGCQVLENYDEFNDFMNICRNGLHYWGNKFTYTLFTEYQLEKFNAK